jgi:hypothetical protein
MTDFKAAVLLGCQGIRYPPLFESALFSCWEILYSSYVVDFRTKMHSNYLSEIVSDLSR